MAASSRADCAPWASETSRNLFGLVKRLYDHLPDDHKPALLASNQEELIFDKIDSGYLVSVATTEGAGRSSTAQLLHASEAAFWVDLQEQFAALVQTVPDIDGSEIIVETTGNAYGDPFHQFWRKCEAGKSEFVPIFLPCSLDPEYRAKVPEDFTLTAEEKDLAAPHGLDDEQMSWRRNKISQLGDLDLFKREYPIDPTEAFLASKFDSFIPPHLVMHARKSNGDIEPSGPLMIGVDPAGKAGWLHRCSGPNHDWPDDYRAGRAIDARPDDTWPARMGHPSRRLRALHPGRYGP
jgi:hypothetical protein